MPAGEERRDRDRQNSFLLGRRRRVDPAFMAPARDTISADRHDAEARVDRSGAGENGAGLAMMGGGHTD